MKKLILLCLCMCLILPLASCTNQNEEETTKKEEENPVRTFNVLDYNVVNNSAELQTEKLQAVLDLCQENGGTVIFPAGKYYTAGLYVHSNTTIHLCENCIIYASTNLEDYADYDIPADMDQYDDPHVIQWTVGTHYRAAIFSAIQEENICIEGEGWTSIMHGRDSFNREGEENFRGAHGLFFSSCKNILLQNFSSERHGNFHFQLDNCDGITVKNMQMLAGHDGLHLHGCKNIKVTNCIIHTGDDCLSGLNMHNLYMSDCDLNTSCNVFRMSGENVVIQNTKIWGPGIYPHRLSVVLGENNILPDSAGRHNTCELISYETSYTHPESTPGDVTFIDCEISNINSIVSLVDHCFQYYKPFGLLTFRNCTITGLATTSEVTNCSGGEAEFFFINTPISFANSDYNKAPITVKNGQYPTNVYYEE